MALEHSYVKDVQEHESIIIMLRLLAAMDNFSYVDRLSNAVDIETAKQSLREALRVFQSLIRGRDVKKITLDDKEYVVVYESIENATTLDIKNRLYGGGKYRVVKIEENKIQFIYPIDKLTFLEKDVEKLISKIEEKGIVIANTLATLALA